MIGISCIHYVALLILHTIGAEEKTRLSFGGSGDVHDQAHINQHLLDKIDVEKMTPEQQQFHYFFMHDLNKDGVVDGIEILKALSHDHENHDDSRGPGTPVTDEEDMIKTIDQVLEENDFNGDGCIDFAEYLRKQVEESTLP